MISEKSLVKIYGPVNSVPITIEEAFAGCGGEKTVSARCNFGFMAKEHEEVTLISHHSSQNSLHAKPVISFCHSGGRV